MITTDRVRAARKAQQLERLKNKGDPEWYAKQPQQVQLAKLNEAVREAREALKTAQEAVDVALIDGQGYELAVSGLEEATRKLATAEAAVFNAKGRSSATIGG